MISNISQFTSNIYKLHFKRWPSRGAGARLLVLGTKCLDDNVMDVSYMEQWGRWSRIVRAVCCVTVMDNGELTDCSNWVVTSLTTITGAKERERSNGDIFSWHLVHWSWDWENPVTRESVMIKEGFLELSVDIHLVRDHGGQCQTSRSPDFCPGKYGTLGPGHLQFLLKIRLRDAGLLLIYLLRYVTTWSLVSSSLGLRQVSSAMRWQSIF